MKRIQILLILVFNILLLQGQNQTQIPSVYSNIIPNEQGQLVFTPISGGEEGILTEKSPFYTLDNLRIQPTGTQEGLQFDFKNEKFTGTLYCGFYAHNTSKFPQAVFFDKAIPIVKGVAEVNLASKTGKYDIAHWEEKGQAKLGYRITDAYGKIIYNGKINIEGKGPFRTALSIIEGPFINKVTPTSAVISFTTNKPCSPKVVVNGQTYEALAKMANPMGDVHHEIRVHHLSANTAYEYTVQYGDYSETYSLNTNPEPGSRKPFVFGYTSDSRAGKGGGERNIYGSNGYIMKRMAAQAIYEDAAFFQFTGDLINGYSSSIGETQLQFANWKRTVEPFWHYMPFYIGPGNHEAVVSVFADGSAYGVQVDKFPFNSHSTERIFADAFVNFENGPVSEDGAMYDPNGRNTDFPPYKETVFSYTYDNMAMVVMNSNYWYAPSVSKIPQIGGNPHGYIMDMQLRWLEETLAQYEKDPNIDHVFVTIHTPAFPNGGHAYNDMWYYGNNEIRPVVAGIPVEEGIIERRDAFLDIMINKNNKVVALLCGDEHNYSRMKLTKKTPIYPEGWNKKKLKVSRPFWQITNGSAGAPYYGQEVLPWSASVEKFSTQYALMLFYIHGNTIKLRVMNPDTLEEIEEVVLRGE